MHEESHGDNMRNFVNGFTRDVIASRRKILRNGERTEEKRIGSASRMSRSVLQTRTGPSVIATLPLVHDPFLSSDFLVFILFHFLLIPLRILNARYDLQRK